MVNKLVVAGKALQGFSKHLFSTNPERYKKANYFFADPKLDIDRSRNLDDFELKTLELFNIKGPYVQFIPPAKIGKKWSKICSDYSFSARMKEAIKFDKLFLHQEKTLAAIKDKKNVIVTANTGRGKTEAWLLPILDELCKIKINKEYGSSPKVVLIYPTKALAYDQFRRIVSILSRINRNESIDGQITVGIYDADTPINWRDSEDISLDLMCPEYNPSSGVCKLCSKHLFVNDRKKTAYLPFKKPGECQLKLDLSFIKITRKDIESGVDIILTNPDIINQRLVNINSHQQGFLSSDLQYVVLDEVHLYSGIFGSYVGNILRRLTQIRHKTNKNHPDLQFIGASATISKPVEIFQSLTGICDSKSIIHVSEELHDLSEIKINELPETKILKILLSEYLKEDLLIKCLDYFYNNVTQKSEYTNTSEYEVLHNIFSSINSESGLKNEITEQGKINFLSLSLMNEIYFSLSDLQSKGETLTDRVINRTISKIVNSEDTNVINKISHNFFVLGSLLGVIERRIHIFLWPMNGLYQCVDCYRIYKEPIGKCLCGSQFIFSVVSSRKYQNFVFQGDYCTKCNYIYSIQTGIDISPIVSGHKKCPDCKNTTYTIFWKPSLICDECSKEVDPFLCDDCGKSLTITENGFACINPSCDTFHTFEQFEKSLTHCKSCNSELIQLNERELAQNNDKILAKIRPVWRNLKTGELLSNLTSDLKNKKFVLEGLIETHNTETLYFCDECSRSFVPSFTANEQCPYCQNEKIEIRREQLSKTPRLGNFVLNNGILEYTKLSKTYFNSLVVHNPDVLNSSVLRLEYERVSRSPESDKFFHRYFSTPSFITNVITQYLLKTDFAHKKNEEDYVEEERFSFYPKSIIFSDSYRDVNRHNGDILESEMTIYIRNNILSNLEDGPQKLIDLYTNIQRKEFDGIKTSRLKRAKDISSLIFDTLQKSTNKTRDFIISQFLPGFFSEFVKFSRSRSYHKQGFLIKEGLVNVGFDKFHEDPVKKTILRILIDYGFLDYYEIYVRLRKEFATKLGKHINLEFETATEEFREKVQELIEDEIIFEFEGDGVAPPLVINYKNVICSLVGKSNPILYNPVTDKFIPEWFVQTSIDDAEIKNLIEYKLSIYDRGSVFSRNFNYYAYVFMNQTNMMLYPSTYRGDIKAELRKKVENYFRSGELNILCSTSALEVGIDIGDLDYITLYGTPPNINAYLQRIGRAGRTTKSSVVASISKRNPIDYYYYWNPNKLMYSEAETIPLNVHNEIVLTNSIYWTMLDFLTNRFMFNIVQGAVGLDINTPDYVERTDPLKREKYVYQYIVRQFSANRLLMETHEGGQQVRIMNLFLSAFKRNEDEFKRWLERIYNYNFCHVCGYITDKGQCCSCKTVKAIDFIYSKELYDKAIKLLTDTVYAIPIVERQLQEQFKEISERMVSDPSSVAELSDKLRSILSKIQNLSTGLPFMSVLQQLSGAYDFSIRSTTQPVTASISAVSGTKEDIFERDRQMAIKELFPGAIYNHFYKRYAVTSVEFDHEKTLDIKYCPSCGLNVPVDVERCSECNGELENQKLFSLKSSELTPITDDTYSLQEIYRKSTKAIDAKETIGVLTHIVENIKEFESNVIKRVFIFHEKELLGEIQYGPVQVLSFLKDYYVKYSRGIVESQKIKVCTFQDCNSPVTFKGTEFQCLKSDQHLPNWIQDRPLGDEIDTYGIRLKLETDKMISAELCHTLVHGLRSTIQKLSGVDIREINEFFYNPWDIFLYESTPGGNGVIAALFDKRLDKYVKLDEMKTIVQTLASECNCSDSCPSCFMQIFCNNDNSLLSRKIVKEMISKITFSDESRL